jgi:hypothetical protein
MADFDTTLSPSPPLELVTYVCAEPGASIKIEGFAYFEILTVALDGEEEALIEATLVKSGLLTCFEEDVTMRITRSIARDRIVSRAEAMDSQNRIHVWKLKKGVFAQPFTEYVSSKTPLICFVANALCQCVDLPALCRQ